MSARRLQIDYARAPRQRRWPGVLLLGVAVAVAAALSARFQDLQVELARTFVPAAPAGASIRGAPQTQAAQLDARRKNAEAVMRQLALPWPAYVQGLEEAAVPQVVLLQVHPDAQQRIVRVTAEAPDKQLMTEYLRKLALGKAFSEVHLLGYRVQEDGNAPAIQFSIQAALRGPQ